MKQKILKSLAPIVTACNLAPTMALTSCGDKVELRIISIDNITSVGLGWEPGIEEVNFYSWKIVFDTQNYDFGFDSIMQEDGGYIPHFNERTLNGYLLEDNVLSITQEYSKKAVVLNCHLVPKNIF